MSKIFDMEDIILKILYVYPHIYILWYIWNLFACYRMPHVNNNIYLELAKLDYAKCQTIYQLEWNQMKEYALCFYILVYLYK